MEEEILPDRLDALGVAADELRREVVAQSATTDDPPVPIVYV